MKSNISVTLVAFALSANAMALPRFFACNGKDQSGDARSFSLQFGPNAASIETDDGSTYNLSAFERKNERELKFAVYADYEYDGYGGYIKFALPWEIKEPKSIVTDTFASYLTEAIYSENGLSSKTEIKSVCKLTKAPAKYAKLAKLAQSFEDIMDGVLYLSEADYEWEGWYTAQTVSEDDFNKGNYALKHALLAGNVEVQNYGRDEVNELFQEMSESDDPEEVAAYKKLKAALLKNFKNVRMFKIGKPDSGALEFYILGLTKDGHLVGLQTITVET